MADVGGVNCDMVKGATRDPTERVESHQVPGIDGVGAQLLGKGDSAFRFRAIKYGTNAQMNTWIAALEAFKGDIVTIVDDWGDSHTKCLIMRVSLPRKTAAIAVDNHRCEVLIEGVIDS
jgi:hypothetical protein